jgi:hypothetical protein
MTEAEALKRFIPILGRISSPNERSNIVYRILERIGGNATGLMTVSHRQLGALAWPLDEAKATSFEEALDAAVDAHQLVSNIHRGGERRQLLIEDLAAWPDCPEISHDSPLAYWLGVPATEQPDALPPAIPSIEFDKLATRERLIEAFGSHTGMDSSWFDNLKDTPKLLAARKVTGQGGRNNAAPLFCPFEVLQWLLSPKRRKGDPMRPDTGWRLLEQHFPHTYNAHSVCDPRQD